MLRFILLVLIGLAIYWLFRAYARSLNRDRESREQRPEEDMVRCTVCGVHLPRSESIRADGQFFCSEEHRRIAAK